MIFGHPKTKVWTKEDILLQKDRIERKEKVTKTQLYLSINPYALILYLNEIIGILHKIIAIITKLQIKQKHNDNSTSNKGA
jgi:hypothetical protein